MRKQRVIAVALFSFVAALGGHPLLQKHARAQIVGGPLPPVPTPPDIIQLEPIEKLGKFMLYDDTMSDPSGYACATCHAPTTGLVSGLESIVNLRGGPQPGIIPGRFGPRKPMSYGYAAFSPEGPFFDPQNAVFIGGNFWDGRAFDTSVQAQGPPINPKGASRGQTEFQVNLKLGLSQRAPIPRDPKHRPDSSTPDPRVVPRTRIQCE